MSTKSALAYTRWMPAALLAAGAALPATAADDAMSESRQTQQSIDAAGRETQARIDQLSQQAREMLAEYRRARDEAASLEVYNEQLATQVKSQNEEIASVQEQLATIDATRKEFVPFMVRAIDTLDTFVERDVPFRRDEREQRVRDLRGLMERADVTTAEKFRKIMKAYQTEIGYGRNIGTYEGKLEIDGEQRTVQFLRVGRIALLYQTLDGRHTGYWDQSAGEWKPASEYRRSVEHGLRVASEQAPPDLLHVPLSAPRQTREPAALKAATEPKAGDNRQAAAEAGDEQQANTAGDGNEG